MDQRVAIVRTGGWGLVRRDEYPRVVEAVEWVFEHASSEERRFAVRVAADAEEAAVHEKGAGWPAGLVQPKLFGLS